MKRFIENVLRSTLSYPNKTSKECIQFLNVVHLALIDITTSVVIVTDYKGSHD
jgi:hypothetical protein